jgi:hypothetical protein
VNLTLCNILKCRLAIKHAIIQVNSFITFALINLAPLLIVFRRCVRKPFFCIWFLIVLIYIFYVEFYTYFNNTSSWLEPKCVNQKDCTKVLLVADPQIIGQRREIIHSITPFSIIDSDLYLKKTYYWAFRFTQPDIVIFLGDLMDEGSIAPDEEFYGYVRRIFDIFIEKSPSTVKVIKSLHLKSSLYC